MTISSGNAIANTYLSNNRNQYTCIQEVSAPLRETSCDLDGNMTRHKKIRMEQGCFKTQVMYWLMEGPIDANGGFASNLSLTAPA